MEATDRQLVRINIGSGLTHFPGRSWISVDRNGDPDIVSDAYPLPFETDYADEVWAIHLFEHLHRSEANTALYEWYRVLKPGGKLILELPCLDKIAKMIVDGEKNIRMTMFGLFGDPRETHADMMHKWCWSQAELTEALIGVNYQEIQFMDPIFHVATRDMRVEARKPSTTKEVPCRLVC